MTIYKSPYPAVAQFSEETAFTYLFPGNKAANPSKTAIIVTTTGAKLSYQQLLDDSLSFADGIHKAGVKKGESVLIFAPNSALYCILLLAAPAAGVVVSMANAAYLPDELAHQLKEAKTSLMLVSAELASVAKEGAKLAGVKEDRIYVIPGPDGKSAKDVGLRDVEELRGNKNFKPIKVDIDSPAYLPFSSGTTSKPKGVVVSHRNTTSVSLQFTNVPQMFDNGEDVVLGALPLSHIYGLICLLYQTVHNGGTLALMPKFDLEMYCEAIQKYKATIGLIVPPIAIGLAKHPLVAKYDLSSLKFLMSGAAPLSASLQDALQKRLKGNSMVVQGYGMTETSCCAIIPTVTDSMTGTCGKLFPSMEARLVDEEGKDVPLGEQGELWLRGPNIMVGYLNNKKATDETLTSDGWLKTGDVCEMSRSERNPEHEFISVVDRRKELVKYKGFQVIPSELEAVLLTCPFVADAAVIGVWSEEQATELVRAYIVPDSAYDGDSDVCHKIAEYVKSKVAAHKRLRGGVFRREVIPKSPSGKILRKELRAEAAKELSAASKL